MYIELFLLKRCLAEESELTSTLSNSFFVVPVAHFPWSVKGRERRAPKTDRETV